MADKKKFFVISLTGKHVVEAESEEEAWDKAIIRKLKPLIVKEAKDEKETQTHL